jgi:hypothetical protein
LLIFDLDTQGWHHVDLVRPEQFIDGSKLDAYEVEPGDAVPNMSGERCEGVAYTDGDPGERHRWTWTTRFPERFVPNPNSGWNFWSQWHAKISTFPQAPVALTIATQNAADPRLQLRVMGGADPRSRYHDLGPLVKEHVMGVRVDIQWAIDATGFVQVYFDDIMVADDSGPNTYPGDSGTYFKQGFYRGASGLTTLIRHGHARCETF